MEQIAKTAVISEHSSMIGQKYITHEDDGGMAN